MFNNDQDKVKDPPYTPHHHIVFIPSIYIAALSHTSQACLLLKLRNTMKFKTNKTRTERYRKSAIPYMQRLLNK